MEIYKADGDGGHYLNLNTYSLKIDVPSYSHTFKTFITLVTRCIYICCPSIGILTLSTQDTEAGIRVICLQLLQLLHLYFLSLTILKVLVTRSVISGL